MARVKIQSIIEYLDNDIRIALNDAVKNVAPESNIDSYELFRAFNRSISRRFSTWVRIPDRYIEKE